MKRREKSQAMPINYAMKIIPFGLIAFAVASNKGLETT